MKKNDIDLTRLFLIQKELDDKILSKHPVNTGENRLRKKVLAALVEVGECVNEFPQNFKFWSSKQNNRDKGLVELIDILHFLLSIGLESNKNFVEVENMAASDDVNDCATQMCFEISCIEFVEVSYTKAFYRFFEFAELLGFSWEQIENAYIGKNKINHERQESGY